MVFTNELGTSAASSELGLRRRHRPDPASDFEVDLRRVGGPGANRGETWVDTQLWHPHRAAQPLEDGVVVRGDQHVGAVTRRVQIVRGQARALRALPVGDDAKPVEGRHVRLEQAERRLEQRDVDDLAASGALAVEQCQHRAESGVDRREVVGQRDGDARRRAIGFAGQMAHAAIGLADGAVTRLRAVGPVLPVAADAHQHDPRVVAAERPQGRAAPSPPPAGVKQSGGATFA
jgi:hypothetical protein